VHIIRRELSTGLDTTERPFRLVSSMFEKRGHLSNRQFEETRLSLRSTTPVKVIPRYCCRSIMRPNEKQETSHEC